MEKQSERNTADLVKRTAEENVEQKSESPFTIEKVKKCSKRKSKVDCIAFETSKKLRTDETGNILLDICETSTKKSKRCPKSKKEPNIDVVELKSVLDGMDDEIDDVLEETALKNKLTTANVKHILRHVITNEYVLSMVRNTMKTESNDEDLEEAVFEPKLTRSKVKELREKQHMLPWPMSTPVKQSEAASKALLEEEFPDESSSDEDFIPNEDECHSEEDNITLSPKSSDLNSSFREKLESPVKGKIEEDVDDEDALVIALPESEVDPETEGTITDTEADKIALRTRSKLPLNDTPLEAIEASFIAPDITVDMYDTHCDNVEWQMFLQELVKPIDVVTAVEKADEDPDDGEDDPEYNILDEEDIPDEMDLRFDNTVKVPRKELNELISELMESMNIDFNDFDDEEEDDVEHANESFNRSELELTSIKEEIEEPDAVDDPEVDETDAVLKEEFDSSRTEWMTQDERLQLQQQMRMYIQLLAQSYLLSYGIDELNYINISSKIFLDELKMFASQAVTVNAHSAFSAHNLDEALEIVDRYENANEGVLSRLYPYSSKSYPSIKSAQIKKTIFNSRVFMYPELLPTCGYTSYESKKAIFTLAENRLIALGLEEFSFSGIPIFYIHNLLVPTKTEHQIKIHVKNARSKKFSFDNPIKWYHKYKRAPPIPRVIQPFDSDNVKMPKEQSPDCLPKWMWNMFEVAYVPTTPVTILPKTEPPVNATPVTYKLPPIKSKKYRTLLPRNLQSSPLKQISPILKKYSNQKRHILPLSPVSNSIKNSIKTVRFAKKLIKSSPSITSSESTNDKLISDNISEIDRTNENVDAAVTNVVMVQPSESTEKEEITETDCNTDINVNDVDSSVEPDVINDGEDEEIVEDEPESSKQDSTVAVSVGNKKQHAVSKKKNKLQKDLESSLALLQPHLLQNDPKREERETLFASSYLLRVSEALKDEPETYELFLKALCKYQYCAQSPTKLYFEIKDILKNHPAFVEDFIAFLRPEQTQDCGKYEEYITLRKVREFIRKVEVHFISQPQHLLKFLKAFSQLRQQSNITCAEVLTTLQPLLKNQSHLMEELCGWLPDISPPEHLMTDFEDITIPNSDDDNSSIDSCEEIIIPDVPDPCGGKDCPCECHTCATDAKFLNRVRHCVKCGIKFMDGRIYLQTGKVLKPAQVVYLKEEPPEPAKVPNMEPKASKSKQTVISPTSKNSTLTEQLNKPEVSQTKKDTTKPSTSVQQQLEGKESTKATATSQEPKDLITADPACQQSSKTSETSAPSTSKLPCDVIEDTVFPPLSNVPTEKAPSDFRQLKDMIGRHSDDASVKNVSQKQNKQNQINESTEWTREEDKLIVYNWVRFKGTEKMVESSAQLLKRHKHQVQERCAYLLNEIAKKMKIEF